MMLRVENIAKSFGRKAVLKGVSFQLAEGSMSGIVGENGSGKSTLLKIVVGAMRADSGRVAAAGRLGYCPQEAQLFSQLTVPEHFQYFAAAYGLPARGKDSRNWETTRDQLLEHFQFGHYGRERVAHLSGGTRQKLNLCLALFHRPELLVLDEPYNGFDWETYLRFWEYAEKFQATGGTILVVTHLIADKERFGRIYNLKNGMLR
ncbi:MAG: ABC transporter ATP-binding protein [Phaeodactylibacter sp.]|nr:ABC transporter ATP-binding protein [Phaeodactylibacter sp.]